jgi:hypothetical protein
MTAWCFSAICNKGPDPIGVQDFHHWNRHRYLATMILIISSGEQEASQGLSVVTRS